MEGESKNRFALLFYVNNYCTFASSKLKYAKNS